MRQGFGNNQCHKSVQGPKHSWRDGGHQISLQEAKLDPGSRGQCRVAAGLLPGCPAVITEVEIIIEH